MITLQIGNNILTAKLADCASAEAVESLPQGDATIQMRDYGNLEKVGFIGISLSANDEQITIKAGDRILYQGSAFVIYYVPNTWDFTRL